jgi:3-oxoacyl-[acyl-carrier protein] reductase
VRINPTLPPPAAVLECRAVQHVVISGGEGDLGKAVAAVFAAAGWDVAAPGRVTLDVTSEASATHYFQARPVDLLVCCAGLCRDALMLHTTADDWDAAMAVNFDGARRCALAVLPGMIRRGGGHVIFVSSRSALHPPQGQTAYATAKAALLGLTATLAKRHGPENIRANAILPGFLDTRMTATVTPQRRTAVLAEHALGRLNTVTEVANFVFYLHHALPHTSGQTFQLDSRPA